MDFSEYDPIDVLALCGVAAAFFLFWALGRIDNSKHPRRFAKLASALGAEVTRVDEFEHRFEFAVVKRSLTVARKLVSSGGTHSSSSWYLIATTPLVRRWESHFLKVQPLGRMGGWLMRMVLKKNPAHAAAALIDDFGSRYAIIDEGILPSGWMNDAVRLAIRDFYENPALSKLTAYATLEASAGRLSQRMLAPDKLSADNYKTMRRGGGSSFSPTGDKINLGVNFYLKTPVFDQIMSF
jgi:hypothetical protein